MEVFRQIADLRSVAGPVHLAIGVFDGVHLGHQAVIRSAMEAAMAEEGGRAVVVTFDPHPARVLARAQAPRMLTSSRHQQLLLECFGVESLLIVPFDETFASLTGGDFVRALMDGVERLAGIHVGARWRFGKNREGTVSLLRSLSKSLGFRVYPVKERSISGMTVSSTQVRRYVEQGALKAAAEMLGRRYSVLGCVAKGHRLGTQLGFPTANVEVFNEQLPPFGVYAVEATRRNESFFGVANLGTRPTVVSSTDGTKPILEVHLFDFAGELYGEELEVAFVAYLRPEMRFAGLGELREQIEKDVEAAQRLMV